MSEEEKRLLSLAELALRLNVSTATALTLCRGVLSERYGALKNPHRWRIAAGDLERYIADLREAGKVE